MKALVKVHGYAVDPETGTVYGRRGKPIRSRNGRGYVHAQTTVGGRGGQRVCLKAHRLVWEAVHGPIPAGLEPNHKNGVRHDNRIANLELVTRSENVLHAIYVLRADGSHGATHHNAKLTDDAVREIRRRRRDGALLRDLAALFGVGTSVVSAITRGEAWRHVEEAA